MQSAWSVFKGAVKDLNHALLSDEESEGEGDQHEESYNKPDTGVQLGDSMCGIPGIPPDEFEKPLVTAATGLNAQTQAPTVCTAAPEQMPQLSPDREKYRVTGAAFPVESLQPPGVKYAPKPQAETEDLPLVRNLSNSRLNGSVPLIVLDERPCIKSIPESSNQKDREFSAGSPEPSEETETVSGRRRSLEAVVLFPDLDGNAKAPDPANSLSVALEGRLRELDSENADLLSQVESWKSAHNRLSDSYRQLMTEVSELKKKCERLDSLQKELPESNSTAPSHSNQDSYDKPQRDCTEAVLSQQLDESQRVIQGLRSALEELQDAYYGKVDALEAQIDALRPNTLISACSALADPHGFSQCNLREAEEELRNSRKEVLSLRDELNGMRTKVKQLTQNLYKEKSEKTDLVDRRLLIEIMANHSAHQNNVTRQKEIFTLMCEIIGVPEGEQQKLGLRENSSAHISGQTKPLSDQFVEFLQAASSEEPA